MRWTLSLGCISIRKATTYTSIYSNRFMSFSRGSIKESEVGDEKLDGVLNLQNISYRNIFARGLITGFQFLQAYYPERLAKLLLLNMPWIFVCVWNFVSRFLEKATLEKFVIVKNDEDRNDFVRAVGEANLPEEYGGKTKPVALQDVTINHWPFPVQA